MPDRRLLWAGYLLMFGLTIAFPAAGSEQGASDAFDAVAVDRSTVQTAPPEARLESAESAIAQPGSATLTIPRDAPALSRAEMTAMVERSAKRHRLDLDLVHAVIRAESAYDPHAVSHAGAVGLMQVMPATAVDYGVASANALFEPGTNLDTGMRHLKRLLDKYGSIGHAVMAYNAGEGALERSGGFVTYPETQRYTHAVIVAYLRKKGVEPYTAQARQVVGIDVTPAMARASSKGKGKGGSSTDVAEASVIETLEPGPVTRLNSRLAPRLSRRSESGPSNVGSPPIGNSVVNQNRARFAGDGR